MNRTYRDPMLQGMYDHIRAIPLPPAFGGSFREAFEKGWMGVRNVFPRLSTGYVIYMAARDRREDEGKGTMGWIHVQRIALHNFRWTKAATREQWDGARAELDRLESEAGR
jgi:hypothetical protein